MFLDAKSTLYLRHFTTSVFSQMKKNECSENLNGYLSANVTKMLDINKGFNKMF